jgi:hypothetical protein
MTIISMLLFFTGFVTYTPKRYSGLAKTLVIFTFTALPLAAILGSLGMAHPRYKGPEHPPMYFSEVLMFLIPLAVVSAILLVINARETPRSNAQPDIGAEKGRVPDDVAKAESERH